MVTLYSASNAAIRALATAGTAKTILNIIAEAGKTVQLVEFAIGFNGTDATEEPILVELCYSTQATAGTSTAVTIAQFGGLANAVDGTAAENYTAEPTALTRIAAWLWPPYAGSMIVQYPLDARPDARALGADGLALRCTIPTGGAAVSGWAHMIFEE